MHYLHNTKLKIVSNLKQIVLNSTELRVTYNDEVKLTHAVLEVRMVSL